MEKYIMGLLKKHLSTPAGKQLVKDSMSKELVFMDSVGEQMKEILFNKIQPVISSISMDDIRVHKPRKTKEGYVVKLSLDNVFRKSLVPEEYPQGVEDIVLHFTRGWSAKGTVRGTWGDREGVYSRRQRAGNTFVYDAINEFNSKLKGVATAKPDGEYKQ